jgi:hypothetical protein
MTQKDLPKLEEHIEGIRTDITPASGSGD